jgi:hypothetical protein
LLEAYLAEVITLPELERKRQELQRKQTALETQRAQLEASVQQQGELTQLADSIEAFCARIRPVLETATFAQRRQLVELLIDRVIVTDAEVEIRYVIPTNPDGPHVAFCHLRKDYRNRQLLPQKPSGLERFPCAIFRSGGQIYRRRTLAWAYVEQRFANERSPKVKTYGAILRQHREEHAIGWLRAAIQMAVETNDADAVLQRFLRLETIPAL